jgi:hypothetical protein
MAEDERPRKPVERASTLRYTSTPTGTPADSKASSALAATKASPVTCSATMTVQTMAAQAIVDRAGL